MRNGTCVRCGRHFVNALQLGAHVRFCRGAHDDNLRGANNNIIAVPMAPAIRRISLHSLARRAPAPWGRRDIPVQNRQDIPASPYIRDYRLVCNCAIRQCLTPNVVAFLMLCLLLVVAVLLLCIFLFIDDTVVRCCCIFLVVVLLLQIFLLLLLFCCCQYFYCCRMCVHLSLPVSASCTTCILYPLGQVHPCVRDIYVIHFASTSYLFFLYVIFESAST